MALTPSSIRVGGRYRANRLKESYDVVVIGSGIGGLTTAACLAKMGKKVCVLEQHYTAGGLTHTYQRNGYEWDVGVHYIGDMGTENTMGRRAFDYISEGRIKWAPMDSTFDRIFLGNESYDLVAGKDAYIQSLKDDFPGEEHAIDQYIDCLYRVRKAVKLYSIAKLLPLWLLKFTQRFLSSRIDDDLNRPTRDVLESLTSNQKLIAVLAGQWGDCGLPPAQSSFVIHSMIAHHYINGGYYPVGGSAVMATEIIPTIEKAGGDVFTYASVEEILVDDNRVTGVRMADGHTIPCATVVSAAGVINTYQKLLKPEVVPPKVVENMRHVEPSMASVCLYIGLQETAEALELPKTNLWLYPSERFEAHVDEFLKDPESPHPLVYISFPSAKDPDFLNRYPGRATIEIVAPGLHETFAPWADRPWGNRGEDYEALKESISQRLLEQLYAQLPQLRGKIDYYELSTTLSTDYFCRYEQGQIYGLNHDPKRFDQAWLRPKTPIKGLYLSGQDVMTCGVVGAMMGGVLCAIQLGGRQSLKLAKQIFAKSA